MKIKETFCVACLTCAAASGLWAQTAPDNETFKALLAAARKDLRTEKQSIVDQAMTLEAGQKEKFWGIYKGFQKELDAIWDVRLTNVKKYAVAYESMTNDVADQIAGSGLNSEQQVTALKKKYYEQFKAALGAKTAARWLQTETAVGSLATMQLLSQLPLLQ
jgi:type IV pilus biogenesis protein CpaD/CtpE